MLLEASAGTVAVTRMIGTFDSAPFLHFSNTRKPAFFVGLLDREHDQTRARPRSPARAPGLRPPRSSPTTL